MDEFLKWIMPGLPEISEQATSLKHLPGRHNQKRHGWRYGSVSAARRSLRNERNTGERDEYRRRAGMAPVTTLSRMENSWDNQPYESFVAFNNKGKLVLSKDGNKDSVSFSDAETDLMLKDGNVIASHNHPSGWLYPPGHPMRAGNSFSGEDIAYAKEANLREMHAVTPLYIFSVVRPVHGWPSNIVSVWKTQNKQVKSELYSEIAAGRLTAEEASARHCHEVMTRVAKYFGLDYRRIPRKVH